MREGRSRFWLKISGVLWLLFSVAQLFAQGSNAAHKSSLPLVHAAAQQNAPRLHAPETVIVNKKFNNREIKVRVGGMIRVELQELGAAGYVWTIQDLDKEHFEVLKVQTDNSRPPGDSTGAPVTKTWLIRSKKEGKSELKFIHCRPWEDAKNASDTFILKVRIIA
jgi:predicted secreted protein